MDRKTFEHVCALARIRLDDDDFRDFERKFHQLLEFVDQIHSHESASGTTPLTLHESVTPRRDNSRIFDWEDTEHNYNVPKIIDFEGDA